MKIALAAASAVALVVPLAGIAAADTFNGTGGDDTIYGTPKSDTMVGRRGDDDLFGRGGRDGLAGRLGRDVLVGGTHGDDISGGYGGDHLRGNRGPDQLIDFEATEFSPGLPTDNDHLLAGLGDDYLGFANGRDVVSGGPGDDRMRTQRDAAVDRIDCGPGRDSVAYYGARDRKDIVKRCERVFVRK